MHTSPEGGGHVRHRVLWTFGFAVLMLTVPSQSHFPRSCLSQFAEMLTLHIGAFEDVSVPFLSPAACGR